MRRFRKTSLLCFAFLSAMSALRLGPACADEKTDKVSPPAGESRIQSFTLKHCNSGVVQSLLQAIGADRGKVGAGAAPLQLRITEGIEPNTLIVRGSERDVAVVAEVVKAIDVPEDQLQPTKLLGLQLLPVPARIQSRVNDIIEQLELLPLKSMNVGKTSVLVFRDSGKELDELIKLLGLKAAPASASTGTR